MVSARSLPEQSSRARRRARRALLAAVTLVSLPAAQATASAQPWTWVADPPAKYFAAANVSFQAADHDATDETAFPLYRETAVFATGYDLGSSAGFELSGGVYVWNNVGVGIAYTRFGGGGDARIRASLPHPVRFDQPRAAEADTQADHVEHGIHVSALWTVPVPRVRLLRELDLTVSLGPSIYSARQDVVSEIVPTERGEPFTAVDITGLTIDGQSETALGFHVGADAVYMVTERLGAGVALRYSAATAAFSGGRGDLDVDLGGVQLGAGVRIRF
jgi:opacity protein-like surface antigen